MTFLRAHLVLIIAIAALAELPAFAQDGASASGAVSELLKQGILGLLVVVEGFVVLHLYREARAKDSQILAMSIDNAKLLVEVNKTLDRAIKALEGRAP